MEFPKLKTRELLNEVVDSALDLIPVQTRVALLFALNGCVPPLVSPYPDSEDAYCSSDYFEIFPEDDVEPAHIASTNPSGCQQGFIDPAEGVEADGNIAIFYRDEELMLGAGDLNLDGRFLNGSIPFDDHIYCSDNVFVGEIDNIYGRLMIAGSYRNIEEGECPSFESDYNQVLDGYFYEGDYERILASFSATRYFYDY